MALLPPLPPLKLAMAVRANAIQVKLGKDVATRAVWRALDSYAGGWGWRYWLVTGLERFYSLAPAFGRSGDIGIGWNWLDLARRKGKEAAFRSVFLRCLAGRHEH